MPADGLPQGYVAVSGAGIGSFALAEASAWMAEVLALGVTLHEWAGEHHGVEAFEGRGVVYAIPAPVGGPDRRERWAVRHYQRGGHVAALAGDRYLSAGDPRPVRELYASVEARARGVPTPAVVAGATYPRGAIHRADLVTELVPDVVSLIEGLFGDGGLDPVASLAAAGRLVRVLEAAGVVHADLSAGNILIGRDGDGAHVIDLDRADVLTSGTAADDGMRRRLERSLAKLEATSGRALSAEAWSALRDGYEALP